jgi:hypothetical protein
MPILLYHVNFNNGETEVEDTLKAAHDVAMDRTAEDASPELAPVEIWEVASDEDDAGRIVELLDADRKVTRVAVSR